MSDNLQVIVSSFLFSKTGSYSIFYCCFLNIGQFILYLHPKLFEICIKISSDNPEKKLSNVRRFKSDLVVLKNT